MSSIRRPIVLYVLLNVQYNAQLNSQKLTPFTASFSLVAITDKVSSVMGRDDSWPATVPSVVPTGDCSHWSIHYIH